MQMPSASCHLGHVKAWGARYVRIPEVNGNNVLSVRGYSEQLEMAEWIEKGGVHSRPESCFECTHWKERTFFWYIPC